MKRNILLAVLWTIFVVSSLEIIFYFIYLYKPFDQLSRKTSWDPKEIPTFSEILTPTIILGEDVKVDDTLKMVYLDKLDSYSRSLNTTLSVGNSFVKMAQSNYVVSGTVESLKVIKPNLEGSPSGYEINLKNSLGGKYTESVNSFEVEQMKVFLVLMSTNYPSRSEISLDQVQSGDYLILEKSTNLLSNSTKINIRVEVLRSPN